MQAERVPGGGIQPQTAIDETGAIHLVYFTGDPAAGDLFYAISKDGIVFSTPIRVNSIPGSAVAIGNIRGARIATGRHGRVYIAWNGSGKMSDPAQGRSPMLYTRLNENGSAFEPQRNLIRNAYGIDGGGGIAADRQGRVYVFWHAPIPGVKGEENRRVWVTRSEDDGKTFQPERIAWNQPLGACGCCSLDAYADPAGKLYVLFRSAQEIVHRNMYLLESDNAGSTFRGSEISKWTVGYCVMSSEAFVSGPAGTFAAWESEKKVHFGLLNSATNSSSDAVVPSAGPNQKYPALALNRSGTLLVAWTEGMGWKKGGSLHWQTFDKAQQHAGESGSKEGVPVWSLVAAYPRPNGDFVVLY